MHKPLTDAVFESINLVLRKRFRRVAHYTSLETATQIAKTRQLRFRPLTGMNDPNEYLFGINKLTDWLSTYGIDRIPNYLDHADLIADTLEKTLIEKFSKFYVSCFTYDVDELNQWKYYGDRGAGAAIEIPLNSILSSFLKYEHENLNFFISPMIYELKSEEEIEYFEAIFSPLFEIESGSDIPSIINHLVAPKASIVPLIFKHPDYKFEFEVRIIMHVRSFKAVDFEGSGISYNPEDVLDFIDVPLAIINSEDEFPLKSIVVGSATSNPIDAQRRLRIVLENSDLEGTGIEMSQIAFRHPS